MAFNKPDKFAEGTTFLFWGEFGSGKSPCALSFPDQALIDADSGTKYYNYNNVIQKTNTLVLKELIDDLDDLEAEEDIFNKIKTFNIDSITRFAENQEHAALKVVEKRALKQGRLLEGEGLSFKERGIIKLHYDRFFAKMLNYAKLGKNLIFIAEQKDENETRMDSNGNQTFVKIGDMPNMQKNTKYDFDVVVYFYLENGESKGRVERDRTGTFKPGDIINVPNYSHWKEAIEKSQSGKIRTKEDLVDFEKSLDKDVDAFNALEDEPNKIKAIATEIKKVASAKLKEGITKAQIEKTAGKTLKFDTLEQAQAVLDKLNALNK